MSRTIDRRTTLVALAGSVLSGCGGGDTPTLPPPVAAPSPPAPPPPPPPPTVSSWVAVKWSNLATGAMLADTTAQPPGLSPMEQSRILAMAFLAGHDALNGIVRVYQPYASEGGYDASPAVTYEIAVCKVLMALMPSHAAEFEEVLQLSLVDNKVASYGSEIEWGEACAQRILTLRADDGAANTQGPYAPGTQPGDYQPTPPVNAATFVNWGKVRPFVMSSGSLFRAPPPYTVTSGAYTSDFNEVKSLGAAVGSTRTADQSEIAKFWLESTPLSWQRVAANSYANWLSLWECARFFAMLQMSQADAYVASLDSKYHYNFWRPITAIRAADADGNPGTAADAAWAPFDPVTPPVPEYPSAHACAATAGAGICNSLPFLLEGIRYLSSTGRFEREYYDDGFAGAATVANQIASEIGLSRVYVGYHFGHAVEMGWEQGRMVSDWVQQYALPRV